MKLVGDVLVGVGVSEAVGHLVDVVAPCPAAATGALVKDCDRDRCLSASCLAAAAAAVHLGVREDSANCECEDDRPPNDVPAGGNEQDECDVGDARRSAVGQMCVDEASRGSDSPEAAQHGEDQTPPVSVSVATVVDTVSRHLTVAADGSAGNDPRSSVVGRPATSTHTRHVSYDTMNTFSFVRDSSVSVVQSYGLEVGGCGSSSSAVGTAGRPNREPAATGGGDASSSSSFSISSSNFSDFSLSGTSTASDDQQSRHGGSLDRKSMCSDIIAGYYLPNERRQSKVCLPLSNFLPRSLFSRKISHVASGAGLPHKPWSFFSLTSSPTSSQCTPDVPSTTGLIFENRPPALPPKSCEEEAKHRREYEIMVQKAKKKESKEARQKRREFRKQLKQEEQISAAAHEWANILPHWHEMKSTKKVRELWGNGLPPCVRGKVWMLAIGNELNITKELFQICVSRAQERLKAANTDACKAASGRSTATSMTSDSVDYDDVINRENSVQVIHLDLSRTFPSLGIFQQGGPYYDALLTLLGAYVCYRPDVGYVQGMSFIAAVLLLNLDLFDAFAAFGNLMNHPCLIAFFQVKQQDMNVYFNAFELCFQSLSPDLYQHFDALDIRPNLYLIDWLYTIYAKSLPLEITCRIWDVFLRDGDEFLFLTALGILTLYKDSLLTLDFDRTVHFLTHLPEKVPADELFKCIDSLRSSLQKERKSFSTFLESCREEDISKKS